MSNTCVCPATTMAPGKGFYWFYWFYRFYVERVAVPRRTFGRDEGFAPGGTPAHGVDVRHAEVTPEVPGGVAVEALVPQQGLETCSHTHTHTHTHTRAHTHTHTD